MRIGATGAGSFGATGAGALRVTEAPVVASPQVAYILTTPQPFHLLLLACFAVAAGDS